MRISVTASILSLGALLAVTACGSEDAPTPDTSASEAAPVADDDLQAAPPGGGGASGPVLITYTASGIKFGLEDGTTDEALIPGAIHPAPLGTEFHYDDWTFTVTEAELSTQPHTDPSNPVTVVVQMELTVTPGDEVSEDQRTPFIPEPVWKARDMLPCEVPYPAPVTWEPNTAQTISSCHFLHAEELGNVEPSGYITVRYRGSQYVGQVQTEITRGPDY